MTFRLSSIHLATQFDAPVRPLTVPSVADQGDSPALCMLDGASRAPRRLARLVRRVAMLGLRLENPGTGVRITIRFLLDDHATTMWRRAHLDDAGEPVLEDEFGRFRLIEVSAQGRTRGAALLQREPDEPQARGQVEFDLRAEEIDGSGIVMFGFETPQAIPAWAEAGLLEDSAVGVCIRSVQVEPIPAKPLAPSVSGGIGVRRSTLVRARPGFFVVNPGSAPGPVDVVLSLPVRAARAAEGGGRARLVEPLRKARDVSIRMSDRRLARGVVEVAAVTLAGTVLTVAAEPGDGDRRVVRLPTVEEPTYVRARLAPGGSRPPRSMDWLVHLKRRASTPEG